MKFENFLFKKISLWILLLTIIISLIFAILFGSIVLRSKTARTIAQIPDTLDEIFFGLDEDFVRGDKFKFEGKSGLIKNPNYITNSNEYLLLARFDYEKNRSIVEMLDIKNDKVIHTWEPNINKINSLSKLPKEKIDLKRDHNAHRYAMNHPLLLNNGDLITHSSSPLIKLDICSKLKWVVDNAYHHSNEIDADENIWVPAWALPEKTKGVNLDFDKTLDNWNAFFHDDEIHKISKDGKILFRKTVISILRENNLEHLIFPIGENRDPLHLNDIQPVNKNSKYWKKGDIFLSLRNISLVMLYRPSTNKIIWYKQKPWVFQHDVDIINDHQISIFDNNRDDFLKAYVIDYSETLIYDFEKDKVFSPYRNAFKKNKIRTLSGGLSEILENGDIFVEETDNGRILRMDKSGNIKWEYINRANNGKIYMINWSRIIENINVKLLKKIKNNVCEKN